MVGGDTRVAWCADLINAQLHNVGHGLWRLLTPSHPAECHVCAQLNCMQMAPTLHAHSTYMTCRLHARCIRFTCRGSLIHSIITGLIAVLRKIPFPFLVSHSLLYSIKSRFLHSLHLLSWQTVHVMAHGELSPSWHTKNHTQPMHGASKQFPPQDNFWSMLYFL